MKFSQLREHNMISIFLEESSTKCGEEASPKPFSEKSKLSISPDSKVLYTLFLLYSELRTIEIH